ncbi:MAG: hypothetical protein ACI35R_04635 [Bacillus sp. (in: firmicutes)]
MLELLEVNDLASYLLFASLFVQVAAFAGLFYFLQYQLKSRSQLQPMFATGEETISIKSQCLPNEVNSFAHWLALMTRRKESPDEGPSHVLLETNVNQTIQGGPKWINQIKLYPLPLKGFYSYSEYSY